MRVLNLTLSTRLSDRTLFSYVYWLLIGVKNLLLSSPACWLTGKTRRKQRDKRAGRF